MTGVFGGVPGGEYLQYDADNRRPSVNICQGNISDSYYSTSWHDIEDGHPPYNNRCTIAWAGTIMEEL